MRFLLLIFAVAIVAAGCDKNGPQSASAARNEGKPRLIVVGGDTLNWGDASPGVLKDTVRITNVGGDSLKIAEVRPSCGCTTAGIDKTMLGPGDTASIPITLDVSHNSGNVHKTLTIYSNDSTRPAIAVALTANLIRDVTVRPDFFPVDPGAKEGRETATSVTLVNTSKEPVSVGPPQLDDASDLIVRFDMASPVTLQPNDTTTLLVRAKALKPGVATADITVPTTSKRQPEVKVRLTVSAH